MILPSHIYQLPILPPPRVWLKLEVSKFSPRLVEHFSNMFSVFKQYYTYFHTFFHLYVFQKNRNNITQTLLPGGQVMVWVINSFMTFLFHIYLLNEHNKLLLYLIKIYNNTSCNWLYLIIFFYILKFG